MNLHQLEQAAEEASGFLRSLGNPHRLRILCLIMEEERPVGELADSVGLAQSAVSQHLARMRAEGLIKARRDGQAVYYRVAEKNVARMLRLLESMFCAPK